MRTRRSSALSLFITLSACSDGGAPTPDAATGDDAGSAPDAGSGIEVNGHVVDTQGADVSFAVVVVAGQTTTTNASGHFHLSHVAVPYAPLVAKMSGRGGTLFVGLSSPSPTLLLRASPRTRQSTIAGTVSGVAFPEPANADTLVGVTTPDGSVQHSIDAAMFSNVAASWNGSVNATAELLALRVTRDASNQPVSYEGVATAAVGVSADAPSTGVMLDMVDPPEATLSGSMTVPEGTTSRALSVFAVSESSSLLVAERVDDAAGPFSFIMPASPGMTVGLTASANGVDGRGMRLLRALAPDAADVLIDVPAAPHLVSPALGSTGLVPGSTIEWEWGPENAMYAVTLLLFDGADGYAIVLEAVTTESRFTIPDLSELGLEWDAGRQVLVRVYGLAVGLTTPEAAANFDWNHVLSYGTSAMPGVDGAIGFELDGWSFTTGP